MQRKADDYYTWQEILSQPDAWTATLATFRQHAADLSQFYRDEQFDSIAFTGCGSTYYLSLAAASVSQELLALPAWGLPASEIWLNLRGVIPPRRKTLLVAVSRSGATTETIRACETFRANLSGKILTLSCYPTQPLATMGDINVVLTAGQEESVAQTRAFTTLYLATTAVAALWSNRTDVLDDLARLPDVGQRILTESQPLTDRLGTDPALDRFYFLGSGGRYGLACELSLKMKEMSLSHSEPFHFLEFRHGPKSMVTSNTLIIGLVSQSNRAHELALLNDMRAQGARILAIADDEGDVTFNSGLSEVARNVLYLPAGQMLAFAHALHHGLNPDRPTNLDAVVRLDGR